MNRKKLITYLLIVLTLIMIVDVRYIRSENHLFNGFVTESMEDIVGMQVQNTYASDSLKAEKDGSLKLEGDFLAENTEIKELYLKNDFGSIELKGSQKNKIDIDYTLKVYAEDKTAAEEFIKDLEVIYSLEGEKIKISLNKSQTKTPELINVVKIDYRITIPETLKSSLFNQYGSLKASDLKSELKANNRYGSTLVKNIAEAVEMNLAFGNSEIYDLDSTLNLETAYTENTIKNINGRFNLENSYGFNKIENLKSDLIINSRYGGAEITAAKNIDIKSSYTGFTFKNIQGEITADIEYGDLKFSQITDLDLKLRYADCLIETSSDYEVYNYDLTVEHGDIEADFTGIEIDDRNNFYYQGKRAEHNIKINSEYGDIEIR